MKRLINCTNPTKKPKLDFNLYKKERKLKINKDKLSSNRNRVLLKSRLKVKMFGANWIKKLKREEYSHNVKLENVNPPLPCSLDKEKIHIPILTNILNNKPITVVNCNNIDEKIKKIDIFDENKIVDFKSSADDKHSLTINDNNILSSLYDHSTNKRCPDIATQENTLECKNLLGFIQKEKPDVKPCLLAENEICTFKSKQIIPNLDSVSLTQKENSQILRKTFKNKKGVPTKRKTNSTKYNHKSSLKISRENKKGVTTKRKTNSTKYSHKSSLNISRENNSNINYQIFSNKSKTFKNSKIALFNHSKALKKENIKISKQIIGPSNFRTLDTFFKVLKPIDNLQKIDMSNTAQHTNKTIECANQIVQDKNEKYCDTVETHNENPGSNKTIINTISSKQSLIESYLNTYKDDYNISDADSKKKIEEINPDATEKADKFKKTNLKLNRKEIKTAPTEFIQKVQLKSKTNKHKVQAQIKNQLQLGCQDIKEFNYKGEKGENQTSEQQIIKKTQEKLIYKNYEQIHNHKCTDLEARETEMEKDVPNFDDREGTQEVNSFELCVSSNGAVENFKSKSNEFKNEKIQTLKIINSDKNDIFIKDSNSDIERNEQLLLNSTFHKPNQFNTNEKNGEGVINNKTVTSDSLLKTKFCFNKREPLSELVEMHRENSVNNIKSNLKHKKMTQFRTTNHFKFGGKSKGSKLIIKLFNTNLYIGGNKCK